jgi:hypothetical protein
VANVLLREKRLAVLAAAVNGCNGHATFRMTLVRPSFRARQYVVTTERPSSAATASSDPSPQTNRSRASSCGLQRR